MDREGHLDVLKRGVAHWNHWRRRHPGSRPGLRRAGLQGLYLAEANLRDCDLSGADLSWTILTGASLTYADLTDANLGDATLRGADLSWACLRGANLRGADLRGADLDGADLVAANLREADLTLADLSGVELVGANLSRASLNAATFKWTNFDGCTLEHTLFGDADLSLAKGLELARHLGPSTIGIDTLYRSAGHLPLAFLRGCGVPRGLVGHVRALGESPLHYYACFVSYSPRDAEFAERLLVDLGEAGVRAWARPTEQARGEPDRAETERAVGSYDKLVLVCSEHSLRNAAVAEEIDHALRRVEDGKGTILYPVRLDDYALDEEKGVAKWEHPQRAKMLACDIPDFGGWKEDPVKYGASFRSLLAALQRA